MRNESTIDDDGTLASLVRDGGMDEEVISAFRGLVYGYYERYGRNLPWRGVALTPYHVLVSEVMLQQTQADRVARKFDEFIAAFPNVRVLALTPLEPLLRVWQGLGYNRRAIALKKTAGIIVERHSGMVPDNTDDLAALPGIGRATASSILAFAYNKPVVFIETNIRTVFIHLFFSDRPNVTDEDIRPLVERSLDRDNPGRWYNALMDYGVMLKSRYGNPSRRSSRYKKQSAFHGSHRQTRGTILKSVLGNSGISLAELIGLLGLDPLAIRTALAELVEEEFLYQENDRFFIR
jgi:A/G-specific adenine glycosylase